MAGHVDRRRGGRREHRKEESGKGHSKASVLVLPTSASPSERSMKKNAPQHELAWPARFHHMPARKSADGAVANLVRSGRKQPQRFRAGSSASTFSASELA